MVQARHAALSRAFTLAVVTLVTGCVATHETAVRSDLPIAGRALAPPGETHGRALDGTLATYVQYAMARSPELRASYERWRAAVLRISPARRLPEPTIAYGYYALPVQTRVGPQQHRLSARQDIPWPTRLTRAADAQSGRARAAQRRFEAQAFGVRRMVADAWWTLWLARRSRAIQREQLEVLGGLSETLRARLEVGQATLAELAQVDLTRSRVDDSVAGLAEEERADEASLRAAIGAPPDLAMPTSNEPEAALVPGETERSLREAVRHHPLLQSFALSAEANEAQAASLAGDRFPRFSVGVDWIETGEAAIPVQGSGDDAVVLNVGISVPLWQGSYVDARDAAQADAAADRADGQSAENAALAELAQSLAAVRDSARRVALYGDTLLPQAQSAYESVVAAYAVGRATVAATLLAQRDLLELSLGLARARADQGEAWARLERVVGRPVEARGAP